MIFWSVPVGLVDIISNIDSLIVKAPWLGWLHEIPFVIIGVIQGLRPGVIFSMLMQNHLLSFLLRAHHNFLLRYLLPHLDPLVIEKLDHPNLTAHLRLRTRARRPPHGDNTTHGTSNSKWVAEVKLILVGHSQIMTEDESLLDINIIDINAFFFE